MQTAAFLVLLGLLACGQRSTAPDLGQGQLTVALQVDAGENEPDFLLQICRELTRRDLPATLFVNPDLARAYGHEIHILYLSGFEIALLSPYLGGASRQVQESRLRAGYAAVSGCLPCQLNHPVIGFRPEGFVQNEDTYQLADLLGFVYNAGFQVGLQYAPGHQQDDGIYRIAGCDFVAVPVSAVQWQGSQVCLSDLALRDLGAAPGQWGDLLIGALDEAAAGRGLLVLVVCDAVTGGSAFLPPFSRFLDSAQRRGARFLTTAELVGEYGPD